MMRVDGIAGEQAVKFAKRGWPVIPLHYPLGENRCSCRNLQCASTGKHPMTRNGLKNASRGDETIVTWWKQHPRANIGILTGEDSGLVVLDVDPRHDGEASLKALQAEFGPLPPTLVAKTGGNGWHFYFKHPGSKVSNKANLRSGLDIRGDGGYIVAPPSIHASLQSYSWVDPNQELAPLPNWLFQLICAPKEKLPQGKEGLNNQQGSIPEGGRNSSLLSIGGFLKSKGLDQTAIAKALEALNHQLCIPPLAPSEVQQISSSIGRYSEPEWSEPTEIAILVSKCTVSCAAI